MTPQEAIKHGKEQLDIFGGEHQEFIEMAIKALEQISHLKDRPCEVCDFHSDNGCSKWKCVFEEGTK